MDTLRSQITRLAAEVPALRQHLVPLLRKQALEFSTPDQLQKYLKEHPKADKKKHTVKPKSDSGGSAPKKDDGGSKEKGKALPVEEAREKIKDLPKPVRERLTDYNLDIVGDDMDQAIEIAKKLHEGIDRSADVCKMSPAVCKGNLGLPREKMPQIPGDKTVKEMLEAKNKDGSPDTKTRAKGKAAVEAGADPDDKRTILKQMLDHFKSSGVSIKAEKVPVGKLKATQSDILAGKTFGMAEGHLQGKFPNIGDQIVISSDNHILDGHHRWAALLTIDPTRTMNVIRVDMTMKEMLDRADEIPGVYREDFQGNPVELPDDIQKKKKTFLEQRKEKKK